MAINIMADGSLDIPSLVYQCNKGHQKVAVESNLAEDGTNKGMDLHKDKNSGDTVVLFLGEFNGHAQLWPSCGVAIPLGCWGATVGNSRDLLHGVGPGCGLRITLVYTVHESVTQSGRTAWGAEVAWELGPRETPPMKHVERSCKRVYSN